MPGFEHYSALRNVNVSNARLFCFLLPLPNESFVPGFGSSDSSQTPLLVSTVLQPTA